VYNTYDHSVRKQARNTSLTFVSFFPLLTVDESPFAHEVRTTITSRLGDADDEATWQSTAQVSWIEAKNKT
jgi:hypothetical protein